MLTSLLGPLNTALSLNLPAKKKKLKRHSAHILIMF